MVTASYLFLVMRFIREDSRGQAGDCQLQILQSVCIVSLVLCDVSLTTLISSLNLYHVSPILLEYQQRPERYSTYSGLLASPTNSYKKLSLVVTIAPSCLNLASAMGTSSLLQLLTPSAMTYTLCPFLRRSSVVWVTQMWLSIPTMMQDSGPVASRESRAFWTSGVLW